MNDSVCSVIIQGGGKRRAVTMVRDGHFRLIAPYASSKVARLHSVTRTAVLSAWSFACNGTGQSNQIGALSAVILPGKIVRTNTGVLPRPDQGLHRLWKRRHQGTGEALVGGPPMAGKSCGSK